MHYKRLHIRVPVSGRVILSAGHRVRVKASAINISVGGLCIAAPSYLLDQDEYHIEITMPSKEKIRFSGLPVYQTDKSVGIKITSIENRNLKKIYQLIEGFQLTEDFIKHIDEHDILEDWFVDDAGNNLDISFETEQEEGDDKKNKPKA